ncbi:MAG: phage major capsid protein [Bacteroidales bacterium]|nr:phage major capsid protein [Candidatus Scybalousia scybalohippi]
MGLKAIKLRKVIDNKSKELNALREKSAGFATREAELEAAINEAETEEDMAAVDEEVAKFETEKKENESAIAGLEKEIADLEEELEEAEKQQPAPMPEPEEGRSKDKEGKIMPVRNVRFGEMSMQERTAFTERETVKNFLAEVRKAIKEKRTMNNVGLTIPQEMLGLLEQEMYGNSKLIPKVTMEQVSGTARQRIMGDIPEAIWTEMCATLNELDLTFNDVEVDGYKVGGFFAVCNAILEDNDVNLAGKIISALGQSIAIALDKAIIYGTGTKMPLGIVTRLAQTSAPSGYPATARPFVNLATTNITTGTGKTEMALFKEIILARKNVKNKYYSGGITWCMSENTHLTLLAESMGKNAQATIVAGMNNTMPILGGDIVELPFIPDGEIVYGYFPAYLLVQRAGTQIARSEHARFVEDQTLFKGTARYDGVPVIAEAFGLMSITTSAPTTSITFPTDTANA